MVRHRTRQFRKKRFNRGNGKVLNSIAKTHRKDNRNMMVNKTGRNHNSIVAPMYRTLMRYADNKTINGPLFWYVYRGNSLRDPDVNLGGKYPNGYISLSALYAKWRVYGSKITIWFVPKDSTIDQQNIIACVFPSNDPNLHPTSMAYAIAQPYARTKYRNLYSGNPALNNYMSTAQIQGVRRDSIKYSLDWAGSVGSDPLYQWYWYVVFAPQNGITPLAGNYNIRIEYFSEFFDRQTLSQVSQDGMGNCIDEVAPVGATGPALIPGFAHNLDDFTHCERNTLGVTGASGLDYIYWPAPNFGAVI